MKNKTVIQDVLLVIKEDFKLFVFLKNNVSNMVLNVPKVAMLVCFNMLVKLGEWGRKGEKRDKIL